jgi:medium-chain acyl-[acyl-carrier-protein] hydrolase
VFTGERDRGLTEGLFSAESPEMSTDTGAPVVWTESFKLHSFQVDFRRRATLETICRFFQEAAWNHAEALGVGFESLRQQRKVWVLSRLLVNVRDYPCWGDTITVHTWPRPVDGAFAMRDLELHAASGEVLASSASAWLILDEDSRRPQRPGKLLAGFDGYPDRRATDRDPEKLPEVSGTDSQVERPVRYSDIDVNGHVNNARYIAWLLDSYPMEFHQAHAVSQFEINFVGEARAGDILVGARAEIAPGRFSHSMDRAGGSLPVCRARFTWLPV